MFNATLIVPPQDLPRESWEEELMTGEEFAARQDEFGPAELVKGRVVRKPMNNQLHAGLVGELAYQIRAFEPSRTRGIVLCGEVGIYIRRDPETARAADVAFISHERYARRTQSRPYFDVAPELIVEIVSPDNRWSETWEKINEYFSIGVEWIWVVDPTLREARVFTSPADSRLLRAEDDDALVGIGLLEGFSVSLRELFDFARI